LAIKDLMAQNLTIEEIQQEVLFVRGDIEELERRLSKIFKTLKEAARRQSSEPAKRAFQTELGAAEQLAKDLVSRMADLETRITTQTRLARRATGT
jgi:predicted  nucleic acid-binding Zn-ribbon protein